MRGTPLNKLIRTRPDGTRVVALTPGKRVLFLFEDHEKVRAQLRDFLAGFKHFRPPSERALAG